MNGVDISTSLNQVLINSAAITGITYTSGTTLLNNNLTMTNTNPVIQPTGNYNLTLNTPATSTGSLIFQTQGLIRMSIATGGTSRFYQQIALASTTDALRQIYNTYYYLMDTDTTAGGTQRGRIYSNASFVFLELNAGHAFMITIGGPNVFQVDSTALTLTVPLICNGGGANTSTIDQYLNSLCIQNTSTPKTSTSAITGFIPSDF